MTPQLTSATGKAGSTMAGFFSSTSGTLPDSTSSDGHSSRVMNSGDPLLCLLDSSATRNLNATELEPT